MPCGLRCGLFYFGVRGWCVQQGLRKVTFFLLVLVGVLALCWPFLENPLFFDDQNFFIPGNPEKIFADGVQVAPRWWVLQSMAATFVLMGDGLFWLRLGNLAAHMGTALALFFLVRRLLLDLDLRPSCWLRAQGAAFWVAVFFAVHPLAMLAQGYLIQRTILCATLFLLLSLLFFWRGLSGSKSGMLLACCFAALSMYAKEHAVMLPFCSLLLVVLHWRSSLSKSFLTWQVAVVLLVQLSLAVLVVLQLKGLVGQPYEMMLAEVLEDQVDIPAGLVYPLSFLNQAGLFFKYGIMWLLPSPGWVSIDVRDAFPLTFYSWTLWVGLFGFLSYVSAAVFFLWRGGRFGLLGFAALVPAVLFVTEFSVVRMQEPFVLYRSYLWAPFLFLSLAVFFRAAERKLLIILLPVLLLFLVGLSFARLSTLAQPIFVWEEAAELLERQAKADGQVVLGAYRIYFNLGNQFFHADMLERAEENYNKALFVKPNYAYARYQLGVINLRRKNWAQARAEFEAAISLRPKEGNFYVALAKAFDGLGLMGESANALRLACANGIVDKCVVE